MEPPSAFWSVLLYRKEVQRIIDSYENPHDILLEYMLYVLNNTCSIIAVTPIQPEEPHEDAWFGCGEVLPLANKYDSLNYCPFCGKPIDETGI